ncbi:MAG: phosphate signaling complex protein PhoU [Spirochaetota bacterium]
MQGRIHFMEELARLNHDILTMGIKVEENLRKALEALKTQDIELAQDAKAGDEIVNALQLKIEDQVAILIATQQPVARDLRELVSVFKVTENLERAGDHARHLAKAAIKLAGEQPTRQIVRIESMVEGCCVMIRGAVDAWLNQDVAAARRIAAMDVEIDAAHKALVKDVLDFIREKPELADRASRILANSGYLERVGDHMTNICEAVIFMVDGAHVELKD